eukprot:202516_1
MPLKPHESATEMWEKVYGDSDENWMTLELDGNTINLAGSGSGGLSELRAFLDGNQGKLLFCCLKVLGVDDRIKFTHSKRSKFVFGCFQGEDVSVMKKFKATSQSEEVRTLVFGDTCQYHRQWHGEDMTDLDMDVLAKMILESGGAHKPVYYDFGPDQRMDLATMLGADAACLQADMISISNR